MQYDSLNMHWAILEQVRGAFDKAHPEPTSHNGKKFMRLKWPAIEVYAHFLGLIEKGFDDAQVELQYYKDRFGDNYSTIKQGFQGPEGLHGV